jgi:solute carrier family 25 carnitine/acylcarnitine transporter 20/29
MAGTTVSFIAAPVEHIKARLQVQYAADKSKRMYSGPIDCLRKMVRQAETTPRFTDMSTNT